MDVTLAEMVKNAPPLALRIRRQISKGHTSKIESYGRGDGSGFASGGPNLNPRCALASKRRLIRGHEFGRAGQAGQGDGLEAGTAKIMPCLAMPVTEGVDVLYRKLCQELRPTHSVGADHRPSPE